MPTLSCHQTATSRTSPQHGCGCTGGVHQAPLGGPDPSVVVAELRFAEGWSNPACPDCGHHGWLPPT